VAGSSGRLSFASYEEEKYFEVEEDLPLPLSSIILSSVSLVSTQRRHDHDGFSS
jgi:hypothetical protein